MCSSGNYVAGAMDAAQQTLNTVNEMQQAKANRTIIDQASVQRQNEISESGSLQLNETAMAARAARAHSIAAASGSGINLGSNSFLASLQTTTMAAANKSQVELENEQNAQEDNTMKTQSELNSKATEPSFLGWWVQNNMTYLEGAYGGNVQTGSTVSSSNSDPLSDSGGGSSSDGNGGIFSDDGTYQGSGLGTSDMSMGDSFDASSMGGAADASF